MRAARANPFLARIMRRLRSNRPPILRKYDYYNRIERVPAGWYVETWFMTEGCRWDSVGGCTMCNYGAGPALSSDEMVDAVRRALAELTIPVAELMVSPSGSMLDTREVPDAARRGIYSLVNSFPIRRFFVETRVETVSDDLLDELTSLVRDKELVVEVGLESSNAWIQRFCANKGNDPEQFVTAARASKRRNVSFYANVALGLPFLSIRESVEDATNSTRWALANGADVVDVFPIHVKPYTLTEFLYQRGWYEPPSLWALVEVLHALGPELIRRTEISWYKSYLPEDSGVISTSPTTCPKCIGAVMPLLDEYRATQDWKVVNKLCAIICDCRDRWISRLAQSESASLAERVLEAYERIAQASNDSTWSLLERSALAREMEPLA